MKRDFSAPARNNFPGSAPALARALRDARRAGLKIHRFKARSSVGFFATDPADDGEDIVGAYRLIR